jgi:hypothetical protein
MRRPPGFTPTLDADEIPALFRKHRGELRGIALMAGALSGVFVLDIDPRNDGDLVLAQLVDEHGEFPETPTARTGGGGLHYYFNLPEGVRLPRNLGPEYPGIDVQGDGQIAILPPSPYNRNGAVYEWDDESSPAHVPVADAPPWLLDLLIRAQRPAQETTQSSEGAPLREGDRNTTLTRYAGALRRVGVGPEGIAAALHALNASLCDPKLPDCEVERIAKSSAKWEPGAGGVSTADRTMQPVDLEAIARDGIPPVDYAIERWVAQPDIILVAGPAKMGKSTLVAHLVSCLLHRKQWAGRTPSRSFKVMIFDEEQDLNTAARLYLRTIGPHPNLTLMVRQRARFDSAESIEAFEAALQAHRPEIVVLDSVRKVMGGLNENSSTEVNQFYDTIIRLQETYGCTFILVHHAGKPREFDPGQVHRIRGSGVHVDACGSVWFVDRGPQGRLEVRQVAIRRDAPTSAAFEFIHTEDEILVNHLGPIDEETAAADSAREVVREYVETAPGAHRKDIIKGGVQKGHAKATISRAIDACRKDGEIVQETKRGPYFPPSSQDPLEI